MKENKEQTQEQMAQLFGWDYELAKRLVAKNKEFSKF